VGPSRFSGAVEFLFFPELIFPRKEHKIHKGRKRIDVVMGREVGNPEINQLAGQAPGSGP